MSKLPKAPLVEVIFEIKWNVSIGKQLQELEYLHGDLYPLLKEQYPFRESVNSGIPPEISVHTPKNRFRTEPNGYPLVQVGTGIVTVNTIDAKYFWDDYEARVLDVIQKLQQVYTFKTNENVNLVLQYVDFLKLDFTSLDILKYFEEYLNISIKQDFYKGPSFSKSVALNLTFPTALGDLIFNIGRGKDAKGADGITIHTFLIRNNVKPEHAIIKGWLSKAHDLCSTSFKQMTRGKLYDSFK